MSTPVKVDIWSDVACPWCYIGKRRFEQGSGAFVEKGDGREVEVEFHSFELSPDTPVDFEGNEADYLSSHKGISTEQAARMLDQVAAVARGSGLDYHIDAVRHTNTVLAHQLIHFAKAHGLQAEMTERLLSAYFIEGGHVGTAESLADYAAEVGLDRDEALASLRSGEYLSAVRADQEQARRLGINGVPFYVIDGAYGVSGAQEPATFAEVLDQVWSERAGTAAVPEGADS